MRAITTTILFALTALAVGAPNITPLLDHKIVGGAATTIEKYPYQLSLLYLGSHICGASVISDSHAVTAAHCTDGASASDLSVRAGSSTINTGGEEIKIKEIIQNPNYNKKTIDYDISILKLKTKITFSKSIQPVGLPSMNEIISDGKDAVCTGWGVLKEGGEPSTTLQVVTLNIINKKVCIGKYGDGALTDRMICAGILNVGGKDACQGDSGGPLVVNNTLVGIVSWGMGCARPDYPGIYTNVASLRDFIDENGGISINANIIMVLSLSIWISLTLVKQI